MRGHRVKTAAAALVALAAAGCASTATPRVGYGGPPPLFEYQDGYVEDRSPGGESGAPACYSGGSLFDIPDRRVLYSAIINCQSLGLVGGNQSNVPVAAFAKLFLTLPLQRSQTDLYVELVGLVKPRDDGNFEMVQLYR